MDFNLGWVLTVNYRGMEETPCKGYFSSSTLRPEEMLSIFRLLYPSIPNESIRLVDLTEYYHKCKLHQDVDILTSVLERNCPHILQSIHDGTSVDEEIAIFQSRGWIMHFIWKKWIKVKQFVTWSLDHKEL